MIYGVDSAYPPGATAAARVWQNGWRFWGGYIGGQHATHRWTNADFGALAARGFVFLPIYVGLTNVLTSWSDPPSAFTHARGLQDGDDANITAGACGFDESQVICLDAEYGDWQHEPQGFSAYLAGFAERVNAAGHKLCLYSDMQTLDQYDGSVVDLKWGAAYQRYAASTTPPEGRYDPTSPPPWDAWQYSNGGSIGGMSLDLNSARDDFPFAHYTAP